MAIQIKELIIKGICGEKKESPASDSVNQARRNETGEKLSFASRKQIIDECTAEVMERLKRMNDY